MSRIAPRNPQRQGIAFLILSAAVLIVYSNSFNASWHLDDYENILYNPGLQLSDLTPGSLKKTMFASLDGKNSLYRPVVMLSFGLNRYLGQDGVLGFHIVNIAIHILTAWLLYLTILSLYDTPVLRRAGVKSGRGTGVHDTALLAALLWAIHPMQTQAVTYIVQRMASAGAMFFTAAMLAWLKARTAVNPNTRILWFLGWALLFLLALGCKENTALLPLACLLAEVFFFRPRNTRVKHLAVIGLITLGLFAISAWFMLGSDVFAFLSGYNLRSYTLFQRLMTEARIVVFYLYQLAYPVAESFSIVHDPEISVSLVSPWTTLPAILLIISLVTMAYCCIRRFPVLGFSILFFFLNHTVESTVIPLELVFEHRNYLPSLFIFLPLASALAVYLYVRKNQKEKRLVYFCISGAVMGIVFAMGIATYTRNFAWKTEESLWTDAMAKAPEQARPYQELAGVYVKRGLLDRAVQLFETAARLKSDKGAYAQMVSYDNIRRIFMQKGMFDRAAVYGEMAVQAFPRSDNTRYNYALSLAAANRLEPALSELNTLMGNAPDHVGLFNTAVRVLLKLGRVDRAREAAIHAMGLNPLHPDTIFYFSLCHFAAGNHEKADRYLQKAAGIRPAPYDRIYLYLVMTENAWAAGWEDKREIYLQKMITGFPIDKILRVLKKKRLESYPLVQLNFDRLFDLVTEKMKQQAHLIRRQRGGE